jgi:predicted deacetylase
VIPDNQDAELRQYPAYRGDFWEKVRSLQSRGWEVAQHGFQHVYATRECGLLGINGLSEFAGLPFEDQFAKLANGKQILCEHRLRFETFMAPSHSFDRLTLRALRELGFTTVTDGFSPWPAIEHGLIFLPQWLAVPRALPWGVQTFCLHLNVMAEWQIVRVERFVAEHHREFLTFAEARALATPRAFNRVAGRVVGSTLRGLKSLRRGLRRRRNSA